MNAYPAGYQVFHPAANPLWPGWAWSTRILPHLEQGAMYDAINFNLAMVLPHGNETVLSTGIAIFHCPSANTEPPFDWGYLRVPVVSLDQLATSQYVGSAGFASTQSLSDATGMFTVNRSLGIRDMPDGTASTMLLGERGRTVSDATWLGVPDKDLILCTKKTWTQQSCVSATFMVLGRIGPLADIRYGSVPGSFAPNDPTSGADGFSSDHLATCNVGLADGSVRAIRRGIHPAVFGAITTRGGGEAVAIE